MRRTFFSVAMAGALVSLIALTAYEAEARGGGGGARGGGSHSMSRGGGFGGGGGGGFNRGGGGGGTFSRGGNYGGGGNRGNINTGNVNRGNINTGNINTGNINRGNINTGNINNVNVNRNVNVDVDNNWRGWGGYYDHPVAAGVAIGAVAGITAAAIGSRYYALPAGCGPYPYGGFTYYSCGSAWYKPTYQGDTVVYVVVNRPY